ncbi:MAG TPA: Chromate resistance protein ChrB, partial [Caldimonas sp.]
MNRWLVLTAALPAAPSALRVRIWRSLRATGCATLRDGVYILPASAATAPELWSIERAIRDGGADAHMLALTARDGAQEEAFALLFDRSEQYAEFMQSLKDARKTIKSASVVDLRKALRTLGQQLGALRAIDFFPGKSGAAAAAGFETLRAEIERQLSPGEPLPTKGAVVKRSKKS